MGIVVRQLPQSVMSSGGASAGTMTQQPPQSNTVPQTNGAIGKKVMSSGSSGAPTPAGTPVQNGSGGQQGLSPPPPTNAPKYGTLVPNRIFVGGISASTTEGELMQLFSTYGTVKAAKIIQDRAGVSKGYGFITFESEDDARRPLRDPDSIVLRERRLNIAPAIKKQPFGRPVAGSPYDGQGHPDGRSPAPQSHQPTMQPPLPPFFFGAAPPFYASAAAYYATPPVPQMVGNAAQTQVQVSQASQEQAAAQQAMYQGPPVYPAQSGPPQTGPYHSMIYPPLYMQQYPLIPFDYGAVYATGGAPPPNGGVPPPFASAGPPNGGTSSPPRGPCYAPPPAPPEAAFLYGHPPHHLFHPAGLDPTSAAPGPIYATADGTFDPLAQHTMGPFTSMGPAYGMSEDGSFLEHPDASVTPRSFVTATPPIEHRNTATPVVSLLAFEQQQEKDPSSMQGGRRPPVPMNQPPPPPQRRLPMPNGNRRPPYGRPINIQFQQPPPPTPSFVPPARRPRNTKRRSACHGNPGNEIGAGDAPLPHQDDGLVAQIEALKI